MKKSLKYSLYLFPILVWVLVYFVISFDGLYGQDAYEYLRYSNALKDFLLFEKPPGDYFWGVYYPIFGGLISLVTQNTAMALQLVSAFSLVLTSIYLDKIIQLLYQKPSPNYSIFLSFTVAPIVMIHSILVMSDMFACALVTTAIFYLLQFLETSNHKPFWFGIGLSLLAVLTRYGSVVVLLPFGLITLLHLIRIKRYKLLLPLLVILSVIAFPHVLIRSQNSLQFLSHQWLQSWNILNLFKSHFVTADGEIYNHFSNILYVFFSFFHPIFLFFGVGLLFLFIQKKAFLSHPYQKIFLISILLYALFLGGIPFQNKRFLLSSFPLVIVFLFPLLERLFQAFKFPRLVFTLVFLIQIGLGIFYLKPLYDRNNLECTIAQQMEQYQNQTLYAFDIDIALKGRKLDFNYYNLWKTKYLDYKINALILVNEEELRSQWKGKNPLLNWENINQQYELKKIKSFAGNFNLYRIYAKK